MLKNFYVLPLIVFNQSQGLESWDYQNGVDVTIGAGRTVILDQSASIENLIIEDGGKLVFKDYGEGGQKITLRAKSIKIHDNGEMWVGSRSCRYQGEADVVLFGNKEDMTEHPHVGTKYLWCASDCVLEMHGKEKQSWTYLEDHLFRNSIPADNIEFYQDGQSASGVNGNRLVFHVVSAEGDLRDMFYLENGSTDYAGLEAWIASYDKDDNIFLFFTDFLFELSQEIADILGEHGIDSIQLNGLLANENSRKFSQIAGVFNSSGESDFKFVSPDGQDFHSGLTGFIGPVSLSGEKSGWDFGFDIESFYQWNAANTMIVTVDQVQQLLDGLIEMSQPFIENSFQRVQYSSSTKGQTPIITLADNVSSWEVGDQIMVASTSFDSRDSEVFTIVNCDECSDHQVKLDRVADTTHWGRISDRTGIDQRAEVGLLSRNVRFYGEMSSNSCQYAYTRESLDPDSPNHDQNGPTNQCAYMVEMNGGEDIDMHGAHMITTAGFTNYHVSHVEIFNAGQPRLARYPVHWHHAGYVGEKGGYDDPSYVESVSIHDSFSRFVTIHGTHEAMVKNTVGYNCFGHGYFLEDGYETENQLLGNLGVHVKPGIILPNERDQYYCSTFNDGFQGAANWPSKYCKGLSVFWISNIENTLHDNAAVGGQAGIWVFTHSSSDSYTFQAIPEDPDTGKREWRNNKMSAAFRGFVMDETVKDEEPTNNAVGPQFTIQEVKKNFKSMNGPEDGQNDERPNIWAEPEANWARLELNGWKIHHMTDKNWARNNYVLISDWQLSDNSRSYIIKAAKPAAGAQKSFNNSIFVGMTRNTGHRTCKNSSNRVGDFVTVETCGYFGDDLEPSRTHEQAGHTPGYFGTNFYFKPAGDVYRNWCTNQYYATQGLAIYDTWLPTTMINNTFYDYFSEEGDGYRHAVGVHLNNLFRMVIKNAWISDHTYVNTPREIQTASVSCSQPGCDSDYPYEQKFGRDFGNPPLIRDVADGEKTFGFIDLDGRYNNGVKAFVVARELTTMITDCTDFDTLPGVGSPGVKVCSLDVPSANLEIDFKGLPDNFQAGLIYRFESLLDSPGPLDLAGTSQTFGGGIRPQIEAFRTYTMKFLHNSPPTQIVMNLFEADKVKIM